MTRFNFSRQAVSPFDQHRAREKRASQYQPQKTNNYQSAGHYVKDYLLDLLLYLDGIKQDPFYRPEGDALFHSLQVFQLAHQQSDSPILWTAALVHDVGKASGSKNHEVVGAEMLQGVLNDQIVWLVEHHLDLLISSSATRRKLRNQPSQLKQLEQLRYWDVSGRDPRAEVIRVHKRRWLCSILSSLKSWHKLPPTL